jgi:hypothetical protein
MPSASSASSSDKSIAVLIKKAMAKMPISLNTKKGIDEYYKNAMKEIVMKIKATEKAKKDALKAVKAKKVEKVAKKPTVSIPKSKAKIAKKRRGGYVDNDTENNLIIDIIKQYNLAKIIIDNEGNFVKYQTITNFKIYINKIISNLKELKAENDTITNFIKNIINNLNQVVGYDYKSQENKNKVIEILAIIDSFIKKEFTQSNDGRYIYLY